MGDAPGDNQYFLDHSTSPPTLVSSSGARVLTPKTLDGHETPREQHGSPSPSQSPFQQSQLQQPNFYQQQGRQNFQPTQSNMASPPVIIGRPSPLNMGSVAGALPEINYAQGYVQQSPQRYQGGPANSALAYQLQQLAQYPGQSTSGQPSSPPYNMQYPQQFQGIYPSGQTSHSQTAQPPLGNNAQFFANQAFMLAQSGQPLQQGQQQHQASPYFYQASQYPTQQQIYSGNAYPAQLGRIGAPGEVKTGRQRGNEAGLSIIPGGGMPAKPSSDASGLGQSSVLRGPPRKPKQSGHALWVGNLPPGSNVKDLKDHFSRDASTEILSVFLISKSNCAFVNYKTEESCTAAMARFHDSRFQGVRLVCRLRRSSVNAGPGVPTGPAALAASQASSSRTPVTETQPQLDGLEADLKATSPSQPQAKEKFFVVKSLTVDDLEMSVRNGVWATQSHNEETLNKAYETANAVYLIFSANKSGEYFGYAKMTSPINDDPAAAIEFAPKAQAVEDPDLPKAIPTEATEFAPKGRIIDDSARGTIFWEADTDDMDGVADADATSEASDQDDDFSPAKAWGKPFKLQWVSTNRVPFYRTRGLRNPWNSNREVKIARDGTELETSIGRRLIQMFHRDPSPVQPNMPGLAPGGLGPMMGSYSQMRPY